MRPQEIENWIQSIASIVMSKKKVEDTRVELKQEWPDDFYKTARQIAGHANAAFGDKVLWIIGINEDSFTLTNPTSPDMADWQKQIAAFFQGNPPSIQDVSTQKDGNQIFGLLIQTDNAPYVIKNPEFGKVKTSISYETPFRDGTSVRSARHEDLVRILIPQQRKPQIEVLSYHGQATLEKKQLHFEITMYFTLPFMQDNPTIFPRHLAKLSVSNSSLECLCENVNINTGMGGVTSKGSGSEILIYGPCTVWISGQIYPDDFNFSNFTASAELSFNIQLVSYDQEIQVVTKGRMSLVPESLKRPDYPPFVWGNQLVAK